MGVKSNAQVAPYSFIQTSGAYTAITGGTVYGTTTTDDDVFIDPSVPVGNPSGSQGVGLPIGFNFTYNGTVYDVFGIDNNGWISFGQSSSSPGVDMNTNSYAAVISNASSALPVLQNRVAGFNRDLQGQTGSEVRVQNLGISPNQTLVIQWSGYRQYNATGDNFNFQIRLMQTTNVVEVMYGAFSTSGSSSCQVGLRGMTNTDFNNRDVAASGSWAASVAGAANSAVCNYNSTLLPTSGQIYRWTPAAGCSGVPSAGSVSASQTICPNTTAVVSNTSTNLSTGITYQWMQAPAASGPWTNVTTGSGFNTQVLTTTSLTSLTFYQLVITCTNTSQSATTAVTSVNPNNPVTLCYCNQNLGGSGCTGDNITNVTIIGTPLNNNSTCNSNATNGTYTYFSPSASTTATLNIGITYSISVNTTANNIESLWIDYNQSGTFDVSEHTQICTSSTPNTPTIMTFTVPGTAMLGQTGMRVRSRGTGNQNGPGDACLGFGSGETEDYLVTIAAATGCSGTPGANSAVASLTTICPSSSVTLGLANSYTVGGLTYQWYSSSSVSGPYTLISGATSAAYTATNVASSLYYQAVITCTNGPASTTSTPVQVIVSGNPCQCGTYCTSNATSANDEELFNVSVGTLNNTTACGQTGGPTSTVSLYSNYTGMIAAPNLAAGNNYTLSITAGECNGNSYSAVVVAYMDFNQNGSFTDPGEFVYQSTYGPIAVAGTTFTSVISVPANATLGITRMRVIVGEGSTIWTPCATPTWGETEDYCINITAATPCAGAPGANTALSTATNVCPGGNANLSLANSYTVGGLTYQWFSSPSVSGPYTSISGANASAYSATNITTSAYYQCVITCTNGPASTTSTPVQILVGGSPCQCLSYCASAATSINDEEIFNVTIGTLNNTSACGQTGGPTSTVSLYSNYAGMLASPNLAAGNNYSLSITAGECNGNSYSAVVVAYIDFNQNGSFSDPGEFVYQSTYGPIAVAGTTFTTTVPIPANATTGTTRMRVIVGEGSTIWGECSTPTWGETEDYCITITPATPCAGAPGANLAIASATQVCTGGSSTLNLANSYTVGGLTYQWFSAPSLSGPYTAISGATMTPFTATNITASAYYQCVITCTNGPASTTATPVQVAILGSPVYATVPFLENFDNAWQNRCDIDNVPVAANWDSNPTTGNQSWRRQDDGASALWTAATTATVAPLTGAGCADFHSYYAPSGSTGDLMLYVNLNSTSTYSLSFYHTNLDGDDSLEVFLSTDGGATYNKQGGYVSGDYSPIDVSWNKKTILLTSVNSPTCVLKFTGNSDFGGSDIAIDSLQIQSSCAVPNITITASTATVCNGSPVTLTASGATTYTWSTSANTASISVTPTVNTTYTVTGANAPACPGTKTIALTVNPVPAMSVSVSPSATLCPGMSTTLTANSNAGTYTWSPGGQTTSAISVTPGISTVYNVVTTNSLGCSTNSNVTVFVVVCTGLAKNTIIDKDTFIYPNPNNGNINVLIQDANGSYAFEINDLSGRLVYKTTLTTAESALNIKELANGMYTYKITSLTTKTAIKEGKLIKE